MKNSKSPGSDGLTAEFYKLQWNDIKQYYIESINYSYENGYLTELQKQGIITLLPKNNKIHSGDQYHFYQIIINVNQTGFIKGRYIGEHVRTLMELIEEANEKNILGLIFFADFQKAFDSLDHQFIKRNA